TFYGGQMLDGWDRSAGGVYRYRPGGGAAQLSGRAGGQFTAAISHGRGHGTVGLLPRGPPDQNHLLTPVPWIQHGTDQFSAYPGFDPLTSTYYSQAMRHVFLPTYPGGTGGDADLGNGRGADVHFAGFNADFDVGGGFKVSDKFLFFGGNMNTN